MLEQIRKRTQYGNREDVGTNTGKGDYTESPLQNYRTRKTYESIDIAIRISYPVPMTNPKETDHERHRRSIRLHGYDYSENGAYFVTICTRNREHLFGEIKNGEMRLNDAGNMIDRWWHELGNRFPDIELDAFVVMPNHIHGIIVIKRNLMQDRVREQGRDKPLPVQFGIGFRVQGENKPSPTQKKIDPVGAPLVGALSPHGALPLIGTTLGDIVGAFKSLTTNEYIRRVKAKEFSRFEKSIWHRNYYERIIRDDGEWNAFREYIGKNPEMWGADGLNLS